MIKLHASKLHPRYLSNYYRDLLAVGVEKGITSLQGLTAHGRGEAFDYLLGEKTQGFSQKAIETAAALLVSAKYPVLSVNGNTAILVPKEIVTLVDCLGAKVEVNIFHAGKKREEKIVDFLKKHGARELLLPDKKTVIPGIASNRRLISREGQAKADVVFIPLEDGDRTEGLIAMGKKVITIDLNPLSRTSQKATITIVDNIVRAMPLIIKEVKRKKNLPKGELKRIISNFDNEKIISQSLSYISQRLTYLSKRRGEC